MNFKPMSLIGMRSNSKQSKRPLAVGCSKHLDRAANSHGPCFFLTRS